MFWVVATLVEVCGRLLISHVARRLSRSAAGSVRAIIVGSGPRAYRLLQSIRDGGHTQYRLLGFIDDPGTHEIAEEVRARLLGTLDDLGSYLARNAVDEVLITLPIRACYAQVQSVIALCEHMGIEAHYRADVFAVERAKSTHENALQIPEVRLTHVVEDYRLIVKRAIDVVAAALGLAFLSPVFLLCAILVKLSGPGPVLFVQTRYGFNRRRFRLYKFRTMVANAEALMKNLESLNEAPEPLFKISNDPRITPIGRILRRTSLDELPQLFNVLIGDMSLVGPRPLSLRDTYRLHEPRLLRRFSVRPGLTCLWQVSGRSDATGDQFAQLDLAYIDNWSLSLDARILLKTIPVVISGAGAA
jgi:exopolysaccharide biosynthesis polyprenyl glycosylphosphotransferase